MWYVYIIRSVSFPNQEYSGASADLRQRIADHNAGKSKHHRQIRSLGIGLVFGLSRQIQGTAIREIPEVPLRESLREEEALVAYRTAPLPAPYRTPHDTPSQGSRRKIPGE